MSLIEYLQGPSIERSQVDRLLQAGANPNSSEPDPPKRRALTLAAMNIQAKDQVKPVLDALIEAGADVNYKNEGGGSAAALAIFDQSINSGNAVEVLRTLLGHGADPSVGIDRNTPLLISALLSEPCEQLVRLVLDAGADANVKSQPDGLTALALSVSACSNISDLILERGGTADPLAIKDGRTLLETVELQVKLDPAWAKTKTSQYLKKRADSKSP